MIYLFLKTQSTVTPCCSAAVTPVTGLSLPPKIQNGAAGFNSVPIIISMK